MYKGICDESLLRSSGNYTFLGFGNGPEYSADVSEQFLSFLHDLNWS